MDPTQNQQPIQTIPTQPQEKLVMPPQPNNTKSIIYACVLVFLVLMVGGSIWYVVSHYKPQEQTSSVVSVKPTTMPSPTTTPTENEALEAIDTTTLQIETDLSDIEKDLENL